MSFCRDGVVWPTEGGFRYGMFSVIDTGDAFSEDYDPEWDVETDHDSFQYVSPVKPAVSDAFHAYDGPNPGGFWTTEDPADCARYDRMAATYDAVQRARRAAHPADRYGRW